MDRKSTRYLLSSALDILANNERIAFGSLIDISKDGIGFKSIQQLPLGREYRVQIRGFGIYSCKILHHSGFDRYGASFLISDRRKQLIETKLLDMGAPLAP